MTSCSSGRCWRQKGLKKRCLVPKSNERGGTSRSKERMMRRPRCLYAMLDKAALAFIYFSILVAMPAAFVKNREWKGVISCKLNSNNGSIYCFVHEFTSTSGEGLLTLAGSTQKTLTLLFNCFVHLVPCTLVVVCLAYVVFGMNCK